MNKNEMNFKNKISKKVFKAATDYSMIQDKDHILVAVSGGKDSLTLLDILSEKLKSLPIKFRITALHVVSDMRCGGCINEKVLADFLDDKNIEYVFKNMNIKEKVQQKGMNCFICSWERRKIIFNTASELGCQKIAFGHHKDDIIETLLLNQFFKGEISAMPVNLEMFKGKFRIIRPLAYVYEDETRKYSDIMDFPVHKCQCPYGADSKRKKVREIIENLSDDYDGIKSNIFNSLSRIRTEYLT